MFMYHLNFIIELLLILFSYIELTFDPLDIINLIVNPLVNQKFIHFSQLLTQFFVSFWIYFPYCRQVNFFGVIVKRVGIA